MLFSLLLGASAYCALVPAVLFCVNLRRFRPPPSAPLPQAPQVSVLIPARDEESNIGEALRCVLQSREVELEVLVLDDGSTDGTGALVQGVAAQDARVQLLRGQPLPPGWNGKQFACWTLAHEASSPLLVFLDADVRVGADLLRRMAAFQVQSRAALVSGFPRLVTTTWLEQLLLPLIHFVLLGFLPMGWMRRLRGGTRPSFAAGCGQFLMVHREAYLEAGGHAAIRETMHDGLLLPKLFRQHRLRTDIADITGLASVRMYDSASRVWHGLAKNATEGIATPGKIVPLSAVLLLGQTVPLALLLYTVCARSRPTTRQQKSLLGLAVAASFTPRLLAVRRFQQPLRSALLHPVGVAVLLGVQWYALGRKLFGRPIGWRQRQYSSETGAEVA